VPSLTVEAYQKRQKETAPGIYIYYYYYYYYYYFLLRVYCVQTLCWSPLIDQLLLMYMRPELAVELGRNKPQSTPDGRMASFFQTSLWRDFIAANPAHDDRRSLALTCALDGVALCGKSAWPVVIRVYV
jgi:hypothetical protein